MCAVDIMLCSVSSNSRASCSCPLPTSLRRPVTLSCRLAIAVLLSVGALAAVAAICARGAGGAQKQGTARSDLPSQVPSQRDVSLWGTSVMRSARKLSNQTVHLGANSGLFGVGVMHEAQRQAAGLPADVGPSRALLAIGQAPEHQGQVGSTTEGETCLRCARMQGLDGAMPFASSMPAAMLLSPGRTQALLLV